MAENPKVHFVELLQEEYDNSIAHSASTLYYCSDTKKVYKGDAEYGASGGNDFVVTYTSLGSNCTADKTFAEITAAIAEGKNVKAKTDRNYFYTLSQADRATIQFASLYDAGHSGHLSLILHQSDGTINIYEYNLGS